MYKITKKMCVLLACSVMILSGISAITAASEENLTKNITLYRYGTDGSITPVNIDLKLNDGDDLAELIAEKCNELLEEDSQIQDFIKGIFNESDDVNNTNQTFKSLNVLSKVNSKGKGFHYKTRIRWKLVSKFKLIKILPPYFRKTANIPVIYCKYANDPSANTTIHTILTNKTKSFEGNHSIFAYKFVGYATWLGRFSITPFDWIPRSFSGYAAVSYCKSLP